MRTIAKRATALFIVIAAITLGLSACGTNGATSDNADNSTPVVTEPVDTGSQIQEVEETTPTQAETTSVSQEETQPTAQPQEETPEETPVPEEVGPKFTEVNETVYATTSVNVRSSYSADSDKVGSLSPGASVTRTGVGDNGWSRIVYGDSVAYVNSSYLTITKPSTSTPSTQTPSTSNNTSGGNTSSGNQITTPDNSTSESGQLTEEEIRQTEEWAEENGGYYNGSGGLILPNAAI